MLRPTTTKLYHYQSLEFCQKLNRVKFVQTYGLGRQVDSDRTTVPLTDWYSLDPAKKLGRELCSRR